jgi:pentatricopeptide repeat protein
VNARYPDFKHRRRKEALWHNSNLNPPWVEKGLATMALGTVQLNFFSWNTRLTRRTKAGEHERTMELFQQMQKEGRIPDKFIFVSVPTACASLQALEDGRCIHTQILQRGCESDDHVGNSLIETYTKCGSIEDARKVFNRMPV